MPETEDEEPGASDELVAALAGGAALTFEPDVDEDDDLLPGDRAAASPRPPCRGPAPRRPPEDIAAELAREAAEKAEDEGSAAATAGCAPRRTEDTAPTHRSTDRPRGIARTPTAQERRHDMADISAELVKELRERTGAGFMDCKKALDEADGDLEKADRAAARAGRRRRPPRRPAATPARA